MSYNQGKSSKYNEDSLRERGAQEKFANFTPMPEKFPVGYFYLEGITDASYEQMLTETTYYNTGSYLSTS